MKTPHYVRLLNKYIHRVGDLQLADHKIRWNAVEQANLRVPEHPDLFRILIFRNIGEHHFHYTICNSDSTHVLHFGSGTASHCIHSIKHFTAQYVKNIETVRF